MAQRTMIDGLNPEEWSRPLNRSPRFGALIGRKLVVVDRLSASRFLRPVVSPEIYPAAQCRVAGRGYTEAGPNSAHEIPRQTLAPFSAMLPEQGRAR